MSILVGIGGCGRNTAEKMLARLPSEFDLYTFDQIIDIPRGISVLQLFQNLKGVSEPKMLCAEQAAYDYLLGMDSPLYIVVGFGRSTGTNVSLTLAKEAHARGIPVYCFVMTPFAFEGRENEIAKAALIRLGLYATAILTFSNDLLMDVLGSSAKLGAAFSTQCVWVTRALLAIHAYQERGEAALLTEHLGPNRRIEMGVVFTTTPSSACAFLNAAHK
jgi:cell division GTPase FtsZ